ncbi:MAG: hypothetical protein M1816_007776 [Peltula sp. TS41687]|nr:MAG: hypothetical protein M1816_007776 [Peltula sp. TS41687]
MAPLLTIVGEEVWTEVVMSAEEKYDEAEAADIAAEVSLALSVVVVGVCVVRDVLNVVSLMEEDVVTVVVMMLEDNDAALEGDFVAVELKIGFIDGVTGDRLDPKSGADVGTAELGGMVSRLVETMNRPNGTSVQGLGVGPQSVSVQSTEVISALVELTTRGDDDTFHNFPTHLRDITQKALPDWKVTSAVYPKYETKGDLPICVAKFRAWLDNHVAQLEVEAKSTSGDDDQAVRIILVAHSMGGFVAADVVLSIADEQAASASDGKSAKPPLIQGVLAMDTPFLGISSPMLAYSAFSQFTKVSSAYRLMSMLPASFLRGKDTTSTSPQARRDSRQRTAWELGAIPAWRTIAAYAGTSGALAAAGVAAYVNREELYQGYTWIQNHLQFVGVIMKREESRMKLARITALEGFGFANLYTSLGQNPVMSGGAYVPERTFCALPPADNPLARAFRKEINLVAKDEIDAHMSMFLEERNPGYHRLLDDSQGLISEWAQREFTGYKIQDLEQKTNDAMDPRTTDAVDIIQKEQAAADAAGVEASSGQTEAQQTPDANVPGQIHIEGEGKEKTSAESKEGSISEQQTESTEKTVQSTSLSDKLPGNPLTILSGPRTKATKDNAEDKTEHLSEELKSEKNKDGGSSGKQAGQTPKSAQSTRWTDKLPGNPLNLLPSMRTSKSKESLEGKAELLGNEKKKSESPTTDRQSSEQPAEGTDKPVQGTKYWTDKIPRNPLSLLSTGSTTKDQSPKQSTSDDDGKSAGEAKDTISPEQQPAASGTDKSAQTTTKWTDKLPRNPLSLLPGAHTTATTSNKTPDKAEDASPSEKKEPGEIRDTTTSTSAPPPSGQSDDKPTQEPGSTTTWANKLPGNPLSLLPGAQRK